MGLRTWVAVLLGEASARGQRSEVLLKLGPLLGRTLRRVLRLNISREL
jgi:hypothetical protein